VPGVGIDAEDAGDLGEHAGLLQRLPDCALARGLAELLLAHRDRPLPGVAAPLQQHPAPPPGRGGEHGRNLRLGLGVKRAGEHQQIDVLGGIGHQPEPHLARHGRPVRVQADQLRMRGLGAAGRGAPDLGPQVALLAPQAPGGGPAVRPVRDPAWADPPVDGFRVDATAHGEVLAGDTGSHHRGAQPFVYMPHSTATFRDVSRLRRDVPGARRPAKRPLAGFRRLADDDGLRAWQHQQQSRRPTWLLSSPPAAFVAARAAGDLVRFREDRPADLDRAHCAVAGWRERYPQGSTDQLIADLGGQFHPDYTVVLRAVLFVVDRHRAREITGVTAGVVR